MFDASTTPRSRAALAVVVVLAALVGATGVAMTAQALRWQPRPHAPMVRVLDARELPSDLPLALTPDAVATRPIVGMLDSLRHLDRKPHDVDWVHFRCVEAATVLSAEPTGDPRAFRAHLIAAFPPSWTRGVGKDADFLESPDGRTEIVIPFGRGRDAVDEAVVAMRPSRLVALAYHLRPC